MTRMATSDMIEHVPIFDFKCRACSRVFDALVRHNATAICPACGGNDLEQLVSRPAVSTEKSRRRTTDIARRTAGQVRREQQHAQAEYQRNYIKDHSDHG